MKSHEDLKKAWENGETIQRWNSQGYWYDVDCHFFYSKATYRIKPGAGTSLYTKEMADSGELPKAGMECNLHWISSGMGYACIIDYINESVGCCTVSKGHNSGTHFTFAVSDVIFSHIPTAADIQLEEVARVIGDFTPHAGKGMAGDAAKMLRDKGLLATPRED